METEKEKQKSFAAVSFNNILLIHKDVAIIHHSQILIKISTLEEEFSA